MSASGSLSVPTAMCCRRPFTAITEHDDSTSDNRITHKIWNIGRKEDKNWATNGVWRKYLACDRLSRGVGVIDFARRNRRATYIWTRHTFLYVSCVLRPGLIPLARHV